MVSKSTKHRKNNSIKFNDAAKKEIVFNSYVNISLKKN